MLCTPQQSGPSIRTPTTQGSRKHDLREGGLVGTGSDLGVGGALSGEGSGHTGVFVCQLDWPQVGTCGL